MNNKKEKDAVSEKQNTASNQEEFKTASYFKSFMSSTPIASKKERQGKGYLHFKIFDRNYLFT